MIQRKVSQVLFSGLGGHASVVFSLIDGDKEQLWEHNLIFFGTEPLNQQHAEKAAKRNLRYDVVIATEKKPWKSWRRFYSYLRKGKPDIILLHSNNLTLPAWWYCRQHHKKMIVIEHTPNQVKRKVDKWISLLGQYLADKVVLLTGDYRDELKAIQKSHFNEKKVAVIPNGIDTNIFIPSGKKIFVEPVQLGMAARFSSTKDQALLVKVLQQLHFSSPGKFKLLLAGDGGELPLVKRLVQELSLSESIEFAGNLDERNLIAFFHQLDIYLHASKGETMSTSIMQAMACGLPIIASDIPGINNLLGDDKGILVENSIEAYADAIKMLAGNKELITKLAAESRYYAEKELSNTRMFKSYDDLIKTMI